MPATFTDAPEVRKIAEELIPLYHLHLVEHRVRMEFVFSDAAVETNGKAKWGEARKITSLQAFLAGEPEGAQQFEPLAFVCALCKKWCVEDEREALTAGDTTYSLCPHCNADAATWDVTANKVIAKLTKSAEEARVKQLAGPPENPGFFVITVFSTYWSRMRAETKRAVVDHELQHCGASLDKWGDVKLSIRPHDLEEFSSVVERHGTQWRADLARFAFAIQQRDEQMALELTDTAGSAQEAA